MKSEGILVSFAMGAAAVGIVLLACLCREAGAEFPAALAACSIAGVSAAAFGRK